MRRNVVNCLAFRDAWAADDEWDAHVFFIRTALSWCKTMLANVKAVVAGVDYVRIIEKFQFVETSDRAVDKIIDSLQGLEAATEVIVTGCYF